jgi:hypothetical protein
VTAATRGRRLWLVAFLGFFLMGAAWTVAMPYNGIPDELEHIIRAAGAGRGELIPQKATAAQGAGAFQHVKDGLLVGEDLCWQQKSGKSAKCAAEPNGDQTVSYVPTKAGRYPPAYYAVVGWPLALWPSWFGVILARLIGAGLVAALLASAAYAAARWSRQPLMPAAILVAVTPVTLQLAGGINPNGVEIAAGLGLFAGLAALVFDEPPPTATADAPPQEAVAPARAALTLIGISAATLIAVRPFGPLWILVALGVVFFPTTRARLRRVLQPRRGRLWAGALAVVFVLSVLWTVLMRTGEPGMVAPTPISAGQALRFELFERLDLYARQMVGTLSWNDTPLPALCYVAWFMAFGLLVLGGLGVGDRWARWRMLALAVAAFAVLVIPDALSARVYGFVAQGRYVLPIVVGLPILAAQAMGDRGALIGEHARGLTRLLALVLVPIHLIGLYITMIRWQHGLGQLGNIPLNPLGGEWQPPLGPELPLALGVLAVLLMLAYAWSTARTPCRSH